jgi:two-component system, NarL family, response regulator NreC
MEAVEMTMRILLADDHKIIREGLRKLLQDQPAMTVVGEAENGRRAVQLARELTPDVVIMDVTMPEMNGIEATTQIRSAMPSVKVIALSIHTDRRFVTQMFRAGASGYLLKDCAFEELARAIRTVMEGQAYLSPGIADVVVEGFLNGLAAEVGPAAPTLSGREREVLQLTAEGRTMKEIASALNVSVKTIETHRRQIMLKLGINSVAELTKYAIRQGLTPL